MTVPSASEAVAASETLAGEVNLALFAGDVSDTLGN
jgi:hypothetical protein